MPDTVIVDYYGTGVPVLCRVVTETRSRLVPLTVEELAEVEHERYDDTHD